MGKNKDLSLPFGEGMEKIAFAFDVDGTLIDTYGEVTGTLVILQMMVAQKWKNVDIIVWSGGGDIYTRSKLKLIAPNLIEKVKIYSKLEYPKVRAKYDKIIAVDDIQDTRLGDVNMIVRNK